MKGSAMMLSLQQELYGKQTNFLQSVDIYSLFVIRIIKLSTVTTAKRLQKGQRHAFNSLIIMFLRRRCCFSKVACLYKVGVQAVKS